MQYEVYGIYSVDDVTLILLVRDFTEDAIVAIFKDKYDDEEAFDTFITDFTFPGSEQMLKDIGFTEDQIPPFIEDLAYRLQTELLIVFFRMQNHPESVLFSITLETTFAQLITMLINRIDFKHSLPVITENEDGSFNHIIPIMPS